MSDLVERYVHQVGHYLPQKERADIEAELRSLIQDQLDDRFGGAPTQAEVATVLAEFGEPRQMATSYRSDQYLVGPDLYPYFMTTLRHVWLIFTPLIAFLNLFGMLVSGQERTLFDLIIETVIAGVEASLILTAIVGLIFAAIQHSGEAIKGKNEGFNPLELPEIDDPRTVSRVDVAAAITVHSTITLLLLYFLRVGGLSLRFNVNDPGEVLAFPQSWMILLIIAVIGQGLMYVVALRINRWTVGLWLGEIAFEVFGLVCLYFAVLQPIFQRLITDVPRLGNLPIVGSGPVLIVAGLSVLIFLDKGSKLLKLWSYGNDNPPPVTSQRKS